jgi:hypothetical protein
VPPSGSKKQLQYEEQTYFQDNRRGEELKSVESDDQQQNNRLVYSRKKNRSMVFLLALQKSLSKKTESSVSHRRHLSMKDAIEQRLPTGRYFVPGTIPLAREELV